MQLTSGIDVGGEMEFRPLGTVARFDKIKYERIKLGFTCQALLLKCRMQAVCLVNQKIPQYHSKTAIYIYTEVSAHHIENVNKLIQKRVFSN